jgi:tetratricopeptide (TPR) repeat protein
MPTDDDLPSGFFGSDASSRGERRSEGAGPTPTRTQLEEGALVPGLPYRLVHRLGGGAFGQVWKAQHTTLPEYYALKFCTDEDGNPPEPDMVEALNNEAEHLYRIQQYQKNGLMIDGLVTLRQLHNGSDRDLPFVEYEFVNGKDFRSYLDSRFTQSGPYQPYEAAELIHDIATIVGRIHTLKDPVVHRDLKPANIMVLNDGRPPLTFTVLDFGLGTLAVTAARAAKLKMPDRGRTFSRTGTRWYWSHEQRTDGTSNPSDDVHAIGVMWYELLVGALEVFYPLYPPSHRRQYDWSILKAKLLTLGLEGPQADLLLSCLKREKDRPKNARVLAERIKELFVPFPRDKLAEDVALAHRLVFEEPDYEARISECNKEIRRKPKNSEGYRARGIAHLQNGHPAEAIADFTEAIRLAPKSAELYRMRGQAHMENGEQEAAIADFSEAIERDPNDDTAYVERANAITGGMADEECESKDAIDDCTSAIRLNPKNVGAYLTRSSLYHDYRHDDESAIADCTSVIRLDPEKGYLARAELHKMCGDYESAITDYTDILGLNPKASNELGFSVYKLRADAHLAGGSIEQAIADYTELVRRDPYAYRFRGEFYEKQGEYDKAIADYTEFIRHQAESASWYKLRGDVYLKKGDYDKAIEDYTEMIRADPTAAWGYQHRAHAYELKGQPDKATADRQAAAGLKPTGYSY